MEKGPQVDESRNPWITHDTELRYDNPWIAVTHSRVTNPSGNPGIYGKVHFKNYALGVLALDAEGYTWLVGQYRYPIGAYSWEIPEGGGRLGLSMLESAQRELLEETGISAKRWRHLLDMHLSNSVTDERGAVFLAQDLDFGEAQPEDTEQLAVRRLPFEEAYEMVMDNRITDSLSVAAILKAKLWQLQGLL